MTPAYSILPLLVTFVVYAFCVEEIGLWCTTTEILYSAGRSRFWPAVSIPAGIAGVLMYLLIGAAAYDYGLGAGAALVMACLATVIVNTVVMQKIRLEIKYRIWPVVLVVFYLDSALLASKFSWFGLVHA